MSFIDTIARKVLNKAVLIEKKPLTDFAYHLRLQSESLKNMKYTPGEHLRVMVDQKASQALMDKVRTYSVWHYEPSEGIIDLAVCTYSGGVGATWVKEITVGEWVYFAGPRGTFTLDSSGDFYVCIGDISALAHLYELRRAIVPQKPVYSLIYAEKEAEFFADWDGSHPLRFQLLPGNDSEAIIEQLSPLLQTASGQGIVYVGGDSRVCVSLNRYFRHTLGWSSRQIKTKPFWNPKRKGLE